MKFKADQTAQKLRGGYYTPQNLADYVTQWVLTNNPANILEPSCGDGTFIESLHNNNCDKGLRLDAFELFDTEVTKSVERCKSLSFTNYEINEGDFLEWAKDKLHTKQGLYDGVLGNPPFIRYQFLEKSFQLNTEQVFKSLGLKFTKHTNAWVPFILSCISMLRPGGRLGMVIPSEIIHVMHAQSLRTYLGQQCSKVVLIDPQEIWFEDTLQGAVIILAQKKTDISEETEGVGIKHVRGFEFLNENPEVLFNDTRGINGQTIEGKWTKALLEPAQLALVNDICQNENVHKFSNIADVDVGIVTGANNFFLIDNETVEKYGLANFVHPMFGRSEHCKGVIYNEAQHQQNANNGNPTNFLYLEENYEDLPEQIQEYIEYGESQELHTRYKCRIRKPWYKVPSVYSRQIGMLKRAHDAPRLIFNELEAYTTDTAYRINSFDFNADKLVYCFINPLTAIFAELEGRYYGGGVLELVPSEIERLMIPVPIDLDFNLAELDEMIRNHSMSDVLYNQGLHILGALGYTEQQVRELTDIWIYLKNRRQRK